MNDFNPNFKHYFNKLTGKVNESIVGDSERVDADLDGLNISIRYKMCKDDQIIFSYNFANGSGGSIKIRNDNPYFKMMDSFAELGAEEPLIQAAIQALLFVYESRHDNMEKIVNLWNAGKKEEAKKIMAYPYAGNYEGAVNDYKKELPKIKKAIDTFKKNVTGTFDDGWNFKKNVTNESNEMEQTPVPHDPGSHEAEGTKHGIRLTLGEIDQVYTVVTHMLSNTDKTHRMLDQIEIASFCFIEYEKDKAYYTGIVNAVVVGHQKGMSVEEIYDDLKNEEEYSNSLKFESYLKKIKAVNENHLDASKDSADIESIKSAISAKIGDIVKEIEYVGTNVFEVRFKEGTFNENTIDETKAKITTDDNLHVFDVGLHHTEDDCELCLLVCANLKKNIVESKSTNEHKEIIQPSLEQAWEKRMETEAEYNMHDVKDLERLVKDIIEKNIEVLPSPNTYIASKNDFDDKYVPLENLIIGVLHDNLDPNWDPGYKGMDMTHKELKKRNVPYDQIDWKKFSWDEFKTNYELDDDSIYKEDEHYLDDEDDDTWTDPAGGTHHGDDEDPASMYERAKNVHVRIESFAKSRGIKENTDYDRDIFGDEDGNWIFNKTEEAAIEHAKKVLNGKKIEDIGDIYKSLSEYLQKANYKYADYDDYKAGMDMMASQVVSDLGIEVYDDVKTIEQFKKENPNKALETGTTITHDIGSPGIGKIVYEIKKIADGKVYLKKIEDTSRELSIGDVI